MRTTKTETREVIVTDDIRCNQCGESCRVLDDSRPVGFHGLLETSISGGYYSPVLPDCTTFSFSLCEPCLGRLFSGFVIQPTVGDDDRFPGGASHGKWVDGRYVCVEESREQGE